MFQNILGQPYAVRVLENALENDRLAGSYLFVGPDGVGKATAARQFAKLLCGASADTDPLARAIDAGTLPDVRSLDPPPSPHHQHRAGLAPAGPQGASPENALLRDLQFEPISARKRVFIIHDAEGLGGAGPMPGTAC